jgi:hypothetical protein
MIGKMQQTCPLRSCEARILGIRLMQRLYQIQIQLKQTARRNIHEISCLLYPSTVRIFQLGFR